MANDAPTTPRVSFTPLSTGRVLGGKFELCGILGEGGTGVVYDAVRVGDTKKESIALKVIHGHLLFDKQIRGRFSREAAILRRLQGPNLCPIIEAGEIEDPRADGTSLLYIALPRIEGPALDQLLRQKAITLDAALDIVLEVCTALKSAHSQGVIHRDLKPANVLLRKDKQAVVVDFGMAKIVTGGGTGTTALTAQNMVFGTPEYMAPEQARGDELDARCDVYAVGIMLYEIVTGHVPFTGHTPLVVLTAHLTQDPEPPRKAAPDKDISPALEAVILHALAKDPLDRYATASALAAAITRAREVPNDHLAVHPSRFIVDRPSGDLAHAATIPAPVPSDPPRRRSTPTPVSTRSVALTPDKVGIGWKLLWVVAILIGVGLGVYLSFTSR